MLKKLSTKITTIIGSIIVISITLYNTERNICKNKRLAQEGYNVNKKILKQLDEYNKLLKELKNENAKVNNMLSIYEEYFKKVSKYSDVSDLNYFKPRGPWHPGSEAPGLQEFSLKINRVNRSSLISFEHSVLLLFFSTSFIYLLL